MTRKQPATPLEVLRKVQELFADRARWTKHAPARDHHNATCDALDETACCWCLSGAIIKASGTYLGNEDLIHEIVKDLPYRDTFRSIVDFNDLSTYEQVMAQINKTLTRLAA